MFWNDVFVKVAVADLKVLFVPRAFTISQDWPALSASSKLVPPNWEGTVCKDEWFDHAQLSQFGRSDTLYRLAWNVVEQTKSVFSVVSDVIVVHANKEKYSSINHIAIAERASLAEVDGPSPYFCHERTKMTSETSETTRVSFGSTQSPHVF